MTGTRHMSLTEAGRDLHRGEFQQQCSCGWDAPGWWTNRDSAFRVWVEHVREASEEEEMAYYPSVEAYTADVQAARDAYAADMAVQRGDCEACQTRRKDGRHRKCSSCRREAGGRNEIAALLDDYDPVPGLVARGVMADPEVDADGEAS